MAAKQVAMNEKHLASPPRTPLATVNPGKMLNLIRRHLGLTYETMGQLAGVGAATLHDWTEGAPVEQLEGALRLLSRLPETIRNSALDVACPLMPSLEHRVLARDRLLASSLQGVIAAACGVTFVLGESDYLRTFVATALAHSFAAQSPNRAIISGYDVHEPSWFVPVSGVVYLNAWKRRNGFENVFRGQQLQSTKMVLLNGIYSRVAAVRAQAQTHSNAHHVLIAERSLAQTEMLQFSGLRHVIAVGLARGAGSPDDLDRLQLSVRELPEKS